MAGPVPPPKSRRDRILAYEQDLNREVFYITLSTLCVLGFSIVALMVYRPLVHGSQPAASVVRLAYGDTCVGTDHERLVTKDTHGYGRVNEIQATDDEPESYEELPFPETTFFQNHKDQAAKDEDVFSLFRARSDEGAEILVKVFSDPDGPREWSPVLQSWLNDTSDRFLFDLSHRPAKKTCLSTNVRIDI